MTFEKPIHIQRISWNISFCKENSLIICQITRSAKWLNSPIDTLAVIFDNFFSNKVTELVKLLPVSLDSFIKTSNLSHSKRV